MRALIQLCQNFVFWAMLLPAQAAPLLNFNASSHGLIIASHSAKDPKSVALSCQDHTGATHDLISAIKAEGDSLLAYGSAMASSGEWLFVGAPHFSHDGKKNVGAIEVFRHANGQWLSHQVIVSPHAVQDEIFGKFIAAQDDCLLVGCNDREAHGSGAIQIFSLKDSHWHWQECLKHPNSGEFARGDFFGTHFSIQGQELIVGVPSDKTQAWFNGKVYVFVRHDQKWHLKQEIFPRIATSGLRFGHQVHFWNNLLVISSPGFGPGDTDSTRYGAIECYEKRDQQWQFSHRIENPIKTGDGRFGWSLASLPQGPLFIGAPLQDDAAADAGCIYQYQVNKAPNALRPSEKLAAKSQLGRLLFATPKNLWTNADPSVLPISLEAPSPAKSAK